MKSRQLVELRKDGDEKMKVNMETLEMLQDVTGPLSVIAVVGRFRIGKSYFLNKMAKHEEIFKTSDTVEGCTKGIWIFVAHDEKAKRNVILLDTEGLFDPGEMSPQVGSKLFALVAFLSNNIVMYLKDHVDSGITNALKYPFHVASIYYYCSKLG